MDGQFSARLLPHTVTIIYNEKADCNFEWSAQFYSLLYINLSNTQPAQPELLTPWYMPWLLSHLIHRLYKAILCFSSILFCIFLMFYFMFFEYFILCFSSVLFCFFRIIKRAGHVFLPILLLFTYSNYLDIDYLPAVRHLLHIVECLLNRWN